MLQRLRKKSPDQNNEYITVISDDSEHTNDNDENNYTIDEIKSENPELFDTLVKERIQDIYYAISKRRHEIRFLSVSSVNEFLQNWFTIANLAREYCALLEYGDIGEYEHMVNKIDEVVAEMHYIILIRKVSNDDFNLLNQEDIEYNAEV